MAKTITLELGEQAMAAYAQLQSAGVDVDGLIAKTLKDRAHRVGDRAAHAVEYRDADRQHHDVEEMRDIPYQIDYVRPPR